MNILKIINDIRIYKSTIANIDGNSLPVGFAGKQLNAMVNRVVMKLREQNFSFGEFDTLYINLTPCVPEGESRLARRSIDRYYPRYRYYDVGVSEAFYTKLEAQENESRIIDMLEKVLVKHFSSAEFGTEWMHACLEETQKYGENMLMKYKEKCTSKRHAILYLRYLDSGQYFPLLRVYDLEENLLFEKDLPETRDLNCMGEIQVSTSKVTIKPRKNSYVNAMELVPMVFEY